jgi:hypothetical protein
MGVVGINEVRDDRSYASDERGVRRRTRTFLVQVNDALDDALVVIAPAAIPRRFGPYVGYDGLIDTGCLARTVKAVQDQESPFLWKVTVEYSSESQASQGGKRGAGAGDPGSGDGSRYNQNPLLRPPDIDYGTLQIERVMEKDVGRAFFKADPKAVVNSAGDKFDPPPMKEISAKVITISRNEISYDMLAKTFYENTINSYKFLGCPEYTVLCKSITARLDSDNGIYFWKVTYTFHYRSDGWDLKLLDQGFHEVAFFKKRHIMADAMPVAQPVPLDGTGLALPAGSTDYHYITFYQYPAFDLNDLRVP